MTPTVALARMSLSPAAPAYVRRTVRSGPAPLLAMHARWPERYPALFESAARSDRLGRHDLLFAFPRHRLATDASGSFLAAFERQFLAERSGPLDARLPFTGGWLVFVGYEIAREIEPKLALPPCPDPVTALALRIPAAAIYEHATGELHLVAEGDRADLLDAMAADLAAATAASTRPSSAGTRSPQRRSPQRMGRLCEDPPERFLDGVRRAKEYIAAGDVYQVNLSRAWTVDLGGPGGPEPPAPAELYGALRRANPAPFCASVVADGWAVLSSSPERLFEIRRRDGTRAGAEISTRPIAGTRPRSRRPGADALESAALAAHPKERAEHVMLVDLERNDLGRICVPGSVHVDELMALESYEHVHHLVSNVRGRLREDVTPVDVLRAVFPGGTITGCPKVRCMQIIAELEGAGRGAYTGTLGYLNRDGTGDFNILIRTLTYSRGRVRFSAGAGIVADSEPDRELAETRAKARGLLRALTAWSGDR